MTVKSGKIAALVMGLQHELSLITYTKGAEAVEMYENFGKSKEITESDRADA